MWGWERKKKSCKGGLRNLKFLKVVVNIFHFKLLAKVKGKFLIEKHVPSNGKKGT